MVFKELYIMIYIQIRHLDIPVCTFRLYYLISFFLISICFDLQTGTLTEGKPTVTAIASFAYDENEILRLAASVEKTASHPIAKAILSRAELMDLKLPGTRGQLTEPGFGTLAEVDGSLVAVGTMDWVYERFQRKTTQSELVDLENHIAHLSSEMMSPSNQSRSVVYVGREGEGIIGAMAISDVLRSDAKATVYRYKFN